jgi:hypothetical protein
VLPGFGACHITYTWPAPSAATATTAAFAVACAFAIRAFCTRRRAGVAGIDGGRSFTRRCQAVDTRLDRCGIAILAWSTFASAAVAAFAPLGTLGFCACCRLGFNGLRLGAIDRFATAFTALSITLGARAARRTITAFGTLAALGAVTALTALATASASTVARVTRRAQPSTPACRTSPWCIIHVPARGRSITPRESLA